jgi:chaperone required for assembly of F1-ATPase
MTDDVPYGARPAPIDPVAMARRDLQKALPRRFYKDVTTESGDEGFGPRLDGRAVRTPAKNLLAVPTRALAEALAVEWREQGELIEPDTMPLTRLANSAIDGVVRHREATIAEVAKFAETDLVCYRASDPDALVTAQAEAWDPILAFARERLGATFICATGIVYVEQPVAARLAVLDAVTALAGGPSGTLRLAALSVMTSLTGSVLIALALAYEVMSAEAAWAAAHVDEAYQARFWGSDFEADARRERRWSEMAAASRFYVLTGPRGI